MQHIWSYKELLKEIENSNVLDTIHLTDIKPIPACYSCENNDIRAIVLGADHTNFSSREPLKTVFGIGGNDKRYFYLLEQNLKCVGLSLENIYVTNMIKGYLINETAKNKDWPKIAELWIPLLKRELDSFDPDRQIPVLATAEIIYKTLLHPGYFKKAEEYYLNDSEFVRPEQNKLQRLVVPFYRHRKYRLDNQQFDEYKKKLVGLIGCSSCK